MASTRRQFLKSASLGGLAAGVAGLPMTGCAANQPALTLMALGDATPRRVIFLVSDGMSMGALSLTDLYLRQFHGRESHFSALLRDKEARQGLFRTHSLNSWVTDSAAASTAWGSGSRVFNGALNMLPDGRELRPILPLVKERGFATGLVTTATVTHATPAGFAAVAPQRADEADIAPQYLDQIDVIMGGGLMYFAPSQRKDGHDLLADFAAAGYSHITRRDQLPAPGAEPERLLGLFQDWVLPYSIDQRESADLSRDVPTLAEMTRAALGSLHKNPSGFLLQVEAALVDWAAHWNDAGALIHDQMAFDDAVGVCLDYARQNPETLIIVTSDHGNANPGLNGMGDNYLESNASFRRIEQSRSSYWHLMEAARAQGATAAAFRTLVEERLGLAISDAEGDILARAFADQDVGEIHVQQRAFTGILGQIVGNRTGIGWTGETHTEDPTILVAKGPGADGWAGLMENTEAFAHLSRHFGVSHVNPIMTIDEAAGHASARFPRHVHFRA